MHEFKSLFTLLFYAIGWDDSKKKKPKGINTVFQPYTWTYDNCKHALTCLKFYNYKNRCEVNVSLLHSKTSQFRNMH